MITGKLKKLVVVPFTNAEQIKPVNDYCFIESSDNLPVNNNPAVQATESKHHSSKRGVKRKYEERSYLGFGFGRTDSEDCLDVLCVICHNILRNSSFALAKMKKHFEKNHPTLVGRNISYFEAKLREIKGMHARDLYIQQPFQQKNYWKYLAWVCT